METIKVLVALFVAVFLLPVVSWSGNPDPKVIEAAKKEGTLSYWTTMSLPQSKQVVDAFHKKYPFIKTELYRTGGDAMLNKILTENRAGRHAWDVTVASGDKFSLFMKNKLVGLYRSTEAKNITTDLVDKKGYWTGYYVNPYALGYNTQMVKKEDVPKTYEELLDPKWKGGKISIDNTAYTFLFGLIMAWGEEKAVSYFKKLAAQEPVPMRGNTNRVQLVMAGEYPLIIAYAPTIQRSTSKGAPIDWVPLEPVPVQVNAVLFSAHAPHPNAGKLFIDFMLSEQGQKQLVGFQRIPTRKGIDPNPVRLFKGYKRIVEKPHEINAKDFSRAVKHYQRILKLR